MDAITPQPARPNALMLIAAVAVIVASLSAVAAIFGWIPSAHSERAELVARPDERAGADSRARNGAAEAPKGRIVSAAAACPNCGVIESVRAVEVKGEGTGIGAVAGGITGAVVGSQFGKGNGRTALGVLGAVGGAYAGHNIERNVRARTSYKVNVRMDDGSMRAVYQGSQPGFGVGDKVRVINGSLVARG